MVNFDIFPGNIPNTGYMFVDHSVNMRSGHLSHALVEFKKGHVMAFYSNCSGTRNRWAPGHNGFGWLEYMISDNYGKTWQEKQVLDYSMHALLDEPFTVSCEKAVSPSENVIVAFLLRNENPNGWEPYLEPLRIISRDGGKTWEEPAIACPDKGRIYDAFALDGDIYFIILANDDFLTSKPEHRYKIYKSTDGGESFSFLSELPGEYMNHGYGNMKPVQDGRFLAWTYNADDEYNLDVYESGDKGASWTYLGKSYCAKRIRNPQVCKVNGGFILHGRSGCVDRSLPMDFVLYTSEDGIHWDEGRIICAVSGMTAYYSNNLVLDTPEGQQVLIQSSIPYDKGRVNIAHWKLNIK